MGRKLLNVILFQAAWFTAVLGAARGNEWYGPLESSPPGDISFPIRSASPGWSLSGSISPPPSTTSHWHGSRGGYLLAAIFGAVGGAGSYYGGARLGTTLALPDVNGILLLAVGWGIMTPFLVWLAKRFQRKGAAVIAP
ncbi:MAG: DUF2878 family protein [Smithella sp.]